MALEIAILRSWWYPATLAKETDGEGESLVVVSMRSRERRAK
jgi:hypothetical protein